MFLAPGQSRSIKSLIRDEYDNGFEKPCSGVVRLTCEPPDLVTVNDSAVTWARAGSGTLKGVVVYGDGVEREIRGSVAVVCSEPPVAPEPVKVPVQPTLLGAVMVDPDQ